jgi:hypothetical protein
VSDSVARTRTPRAALLQLKCRILLTTITNTIIGPKQLIFISENKNKIVEVQEILDGTVDLHSQALNMVDMHPWKFLIDKCRRAAKYLSPKVGAFEPS